MWLTNWASVFLSLPRADKEPILSPLRSQWCNPLSSRTWKSLRSVGSWAQRWQEGWRSSFPAGRRSELPVITPGYGRTQALGLPVPCHFGHHDTFSAKATFRVNAEPATRTHGQVPVYTPELGGAPGAQRTSGVSLCECVKGREAHGASLPTPSPHVNTQIWARTQAWGGQRGSPDRTAGAWALGCPTSLTTQFSPSLLITPSDPHCKPILGTWRPWKAGSWMRKTGAPRKP